MQNIYQIDLIRRPRSQREFFPVSINQMVHDIALFDTGSDAIMIPQRLMSKLAIDSTRSLGSRVVKGIFERQQGEVFEVELTIPAQPEPLAWQTRVVFANVPLIIFGYLGGIGRWLSFQVDHRRQELTIELP